MREINSLYDVDCFYTNGWPPLGSLPDCHCAICSKLPPSGTPGILARLHRSRAGTVGEIRCDRQGEKAATASSSPTPAATCAAGRISTGWAKIAAWFQADNQGRTYEEPEVWGCSLQGRVCNAVLDGKFAANVTAAYSTGSPGWRNLSKSPDETRMWLNRNAGQRHEFRTSTLSARKEASEKIAAGRQSGRDYFRWTAKHDRALHQSPLHCQHRRGDSDRVRSCSIPDPRTARIARSTCAKPRRASTTRCCGAGSRLILCTRIGCEPERLSQYRALILPNVAMLSDTQCRQLRDYVRAGGVADGQL